MAQDPFQLLIVDDTPENLLVLGEVLSTEYTIKVASSGLRALQLAAAHPQPDLILLDVMMPEMDGYAVLKALKQQPETANIPVIFVTALDATEDEAKGLALGAVDYISKPVRPAIVRARVQAQLELKQARDRLANQNQWLEAEVQHRMTQNLKIQQVSMRALASLAEARDNETGGHILRTQHYVRLLAEALAKLPKYADLLTEPMIDAYQRAAPLHDIGKVAIPDAVLNKPGSLTDAEWVIMRTHAKAGADAIWRAVCFEADKDGLEFLELAMEIAHHHHEKWDGSGYPDGLVGDAISLPARLMALADVFDALISRRVYKEPMSYEMAASIIFDGRGQHFDPEVVDAFEAQLPAFIAVAETYADP